MTTTTPNERPTRSTRRGSCLTLMLTLIAADSATGHDASARRYRRPPPPPPTLQSDGPRPPWPRRRRRGVRLRAPGRGLIDIELWPPEPASPKNIDAGRFAGALREMCGWMPPSRPAMFAKLIIDEGRRFSIDPFLIGGLIYRQSLCLPRKSGAYGVGLAQIHAGMHGGHVRARRYSYHVLDGGRWRERALALGKHRLYAHTLRRPTANVYFAAGFLAVWRAQCPAIDGAFGSVPHRHFVSHMIWGDRVRDAGSEDRVLLARRRLLHLYNGEPRAPARGSFKGLALGCPLDGWPRKVSSAMGDERDNGARRHRGIDFESTFDEPVRVVADGRVIFAGIDARRGPSRVLDSDAARALIGKGKLGPGGLYVKVRHDGGLVSAYMHLSRFGVRVGQRLARGELLGRVGRTGNKSSGAHLHFELRHGGRHIDPLPALAPYVFTPEQTYLGRKLAYERWRTRRRKR